MGGKGCYLEKSVLTLAYCGWRAAAAGLEPLRLPRTQWNKLCPVDASCQSNASYLSLSQLWGVLCTVSHLYRSGEGVVDSGVVLCLAISLGVVYMVDSE